MIVKAWAPGHATLFFSVPQASTEPQAMGSLGGGFNFAKGVVTAIEKSPEDEVYWNDKPIAGEVTLTVANLMRDTHKVDQPLKIKHYSELEIGYGLSTSGAGALGTALAVNKLFEYQETKEACYRIAHQADIMNHTGLGSVMGQITGGIELRTKVGGPGIGKTLSLPCKDQIIILMKGKLKTSDVLQSKEQLGLVTKIGSISIEKAKKLRNHYTMEYLSLGRDFTELCGLMTPRVKYYLDQLTNIGEETASMAMIGETIIVKPNNPAKVLKLAREEGLKAISTSISNKTPQLITQ